MQIRRQLMERSSVQEFADSVSRYLDASTGVIHIRTSEVLRCAAELRKVLVANNCVHNEWDVANGVKVIKDTEIAKVNITGDGDINFVNALKHPWQRVLASIEGRVPAEHQGRMTVYTYISPEHWMDGVPMVRHWIEQYANVLPSHDVRCILITRDAPLPDNLSELVGTCRFDTPSYSELTEFYDNIIDAVRDEDILEEMTEEDVRKICFAGAGLTRERFDTHLSSAIVNGVRSLADDEKLTVDDLVAGVSVGKTEVVNTSDLLELYPEESMSNVGGMDVLKAWINKRKNCYSDEAVEYGIQPPKGIVFVGPPGCLSGDTVIDYKRGVRNSSRPITLRELFYKFNGTPVPGAGRGHARPWADITMPTFLHSLTPEGDIQYNRIVSVIEAGVKTVYEVATESGASVKLTYNHPVAIEGGSFLPVGELKVGDKVILRGSMKPTDNPQGKNLSARPPRRIINCKYHKYGSRKETDGYVYTRVPYARLVVEAHMNEVDVDEFVHALKHNPTVSSTFEFLSPEYEVHHVDEDTMNDDLDNLMVYTKQEHAREHGKVENFKVEYTKTDRIASIVCVGQEMTYDIQMDMPANNFVANGIVVHNTGKSLVSKAISKQLGVPLVRFDFGRVFNSLVGKSEERIREALRMVESMAPCVLFIDEIDKGLAGMGGSGGDSGTSARVFGTFLTWLNDTEAPVFTVVTANNVTHLPPELMRKGRFDQIFTSGLPDRTDLRSVFSIHMRKRGWDFDAFTKEEQLECINRVVGFVPAEVEAVVKDALIDAFDEGAEAVTAGHILRAADNTVPLIKSHTLDMVATMLWCKENGVQASTFTILDATEDGNVTSQQEDSTVVSMDRARSVRARRRKELH